MQKEVFNEQGRPTLIIDQLEGWWAYEIDEKDEIENEVILKSALKKVS